MNPSCALCQTPFEADDDTIDCELCNLREHIVCHSDSGHEWELLAAPGRAALARHTAECVAAAMVEAPGARDDESARDIAWQMLEDGHYTCVCPPSARPDA